MNARFHYRRKYNALCCKARRRRRRSNGGRKLQFEKLEARIVLATDYLWDGDFNSDWNIFLNWDPDSAAGGPGASDTAKFNEDVGVTLNGRSTIATLRIEDGTDTDPAVTLDFNNDLGPNPGLGEEESVKILQMTNLVVAVGASGDNTLTLVNSGDEEAYLAASAVSLGVTDGAGAWDAVLEVQGAKTGLSAPNITVGGVSEGRLQIEEGAKAYGNLVGVGGAQLGTLRVTGEGSVLNVGSALGVAIGAGQGDLYVTDGGEVSVTGTLTVGYASGGSAEITGGGSVGANIILVDRSSAFQVSDGTVDSGLLHVGPNSSALVEITNGAVVTTTFASLTNGADVWIDGAGSRLNTVFDVFISSPSSELRESNGGKAGSLQTFFRNLGRILIESSGGEIEAAMLFNEGGGTIEGAIDITAGIVENRGTIIVGDDGGVGTAVINSGDFEQFVEGVTKIDLASESSYDVLEIDGVAKLGGTLDVSLLSYTPSLNDEFTILTAGGGVDGEFDSELLPGFESGLGWEVIYGANDVVLKVVENNEDPSASDDFYTAYYETPLVIAMDQGVLANDSDPDGNPLQVVLPIVSGPSNGSLDIDASGAFVYTPDPSFDGYDYFSYDVSDGENDSDVPALVEIFVTTSSPPTVSIDDAASFNEADGMMEFTVSLSGTTSNDVRVGFAASDGTAEAPFDFMALSGVAVIPAGQTSTTVRIPVFDDGLVEANETLTVTLSNAVNATIDDGQASGTISNDDHAPAANNDPNFEVHHDTVLNEVYGVLDNDTDDDFDELTAELVTGVSHGELVFNADGTFTYTPAAGYVASDSFTYKAYDGWNYSSTATVTIDVTNDTPIAYSDEYYTQVNTPLDETVGVLDNDEDQDALTAVLVTDVEFGMLTLNADGTFYYEPDLDYEGEDGFTYKAVDTVDAESDPVYVAISVEPQFLTLNLPPASRSVDFSPREAVTVEDVQGLLPWAIAQWEAIGADGALLRETLAGVEVRIHDLPDSRLGAALPGVILIDVDAAGYGWFVDPTPWESLEFARLVAPTELQAESGSSAFGRVDLLTVLTHEIGHLLGLPDLPLTAAQHHIMTELIGLGTRRTVTPIARPADFDLTSTGGDTGDAKDAFFADFDGLVRKFYGDHDRLPDLGFVGKRQGDAPRQFADVVDALMAEWPR